tara:strand:+ start:1845 stop:3806 length:1962 start_codon:yes stop_codon:yes gene_type:complete
MEVPILLPKVFNHPFTYLHNSKKIKSLKPGDIVVVPFGKKKEIGVVWDKIMNTEKKIKLRQIEKKISSISLNNNIIKFINWFSIYNLVPKGMILKMCLGNLKDFDKTKKRELLKNKTTILKYELNEDQKNALKSLISSGNKFNVSVLIGLTGSGKTIVYFERIRKLVEENKQALILIPEIFLSTQFKERFRLFFGYEPAIWHSKISMNKKREIWQSVAKNKIKIVLGARSSLFLPFKNLGLIVVDEEHDSSYKQEESVIYNARDMAISRASIENIPINLITSVPSLETYNNIRNKKYKVTELKKRFENYPLPKSKVIDLNIGNLNKKSISNETIKIVENYLKEKNQILFFLNRRGYAPFLICKNCGYRHICPNCSIYLTYHKNFNKIICHHCGYQSSPKRKCSSKILYCDFSLYGPGVEKVFEELKNIFPNKVIKIFSSDYLNKKKQSEILIKEVSDKKIDILVGTQMISKGFNFPKLNCIVVVDADFTGKGYDLRTTEKNIQLYNQLSGRAGRFSKDSIIIYQTINPNNQILKNILENKTENFLINELKIRKENNLPPYSRLISVIISSSSKENSYQGALEIKKKIERINYIQILGPVDSPIFKKNKRYRTRLLIRSDINKMCQKNLAKVLENLKISSKIKLTVDVDPINFT